MFRRAVASIAVLVPMVTAAAVFVGVNVSLLELGVQAPRPVLGLMAQEMRYYLVSSLLLAGEYLLDRMSVRSGRVWSRGIE